MTRVELLPDGQAPLLDRYQVIGRIASGGMGVVWLGRLAGVGGFQRLVAIKQLHPNLALEPEFVEMFLDEARLAAGIHHQNVVAILEVGTADGGYYLVMEYIEGASFVEISNRTMATGKLLPHPVVLRVLLDTLAGLHAAHELTDAQGRPLGLVHRDCTPQNILIGLDGCTKITDFGIARASARLANTREGSFKGKIAYMAPEQTQGDQIDRRADLFSVGVMLWEALTDRRLFKGKTDAQTLTNLLHKPIPRLREVEPDVHPALDEVCAKALAREPDERFQTAIEMADALEQAGREAAQGQGEDALATVRALGTYVADILGQEITSQREVVRGWMARAENTPPPTAAPISSQRPSSRRTGAQPSVVSDDAARVAVSPSTSSPPPAPGSLPPDDKPGRPGVPPSTSSRPPSSRAPTSGSTSSRPASSRAPSNRSGRRLPPPNPTLRGWPPTPPPGESAPELEPLVELSSEPRAPGPRRSEDAATAVYTDEARAAMEAAHRPVGKGPAPKRRSRQRPTRTGRSAIWPWAVIPALAVAIIFGAGILLFSSERTTGAQPVASEAAGTTDATRPPSIPTQSDEPTAAPETSATTSGVEEPPATAPSAAESAASAVSAAPPPPAPTRPPSRPTAKPATTSAPASPPSATAVATATPAPTRPPPPPSELEGLSNPYRR